MIASDTQRIYIKNLIELSHATAAWLFSFCVAVWYASARKRATLPHLCEKIHSVVG